MLKNFTLFLALLGTTCLCAQPAYVDHFDDGVVSFVSEADGYVNTEADSDWTITGKASTGTWEAVEYKFHNGEEAITVDFAANNTKLFVRMKGNAEWPIRIDLVDNMAGTPLVTNIAAVTRTTTADYTVFEYDWTGNLGDAGYGGAPGCTVDAPCQVNASAIASILIYGNPGVDGFDGSVSIDYIAVGAEPAEGDEGVLTAYADDFTDNMVGNGIEDQAGYTSQELGGEWVLSGSAATEMWGAVPYYFTNESDEQVLVDFSGANERKLFVRARTNGADWPVRIDLQDSLGLVTNIAGKTHTFGATAETKEYNWSGAADLGDAGYGQPGGDLGCTVAAPCTLAVDRISNLLVYVNPGMEGFQGSVFFDWISVGEALTVSVDNFAQLDLLKVYPNPATDQFGVELELPTAAQVVLNVFDNLGRRVLSSNEGVQPAGNNFYKLNASQLPTGTYHLQVMVDGAAARGVTLSKR